MEKLDDKETPYYELLYMIKESLPINKDPAFQTWESELLSGDTFRQKNILEEIRCYYIHNQQKPNRDKIYIFTLNLYDQLIYVPPINMKKKAREYFLTKLAAKDVSFDFKDEGEQLGSCAEVQLNDSQSVTFYVKTHRRGLKDDFRGIVNVVDLRELLVYKVLENVGLGPKAHFFHDNLKDFYIATSHAGFNEISKKQDEFITYYNLRQRFILSPQEFLDTYPVLRGGFIKADFLSRILRVADIIDHSTHVGVVVSEGEAKTFKIIGFRPPDNCDYLNPTINCDWLSGNNLYDYSDSVPISILKVSNAEYEYKIKQSAPYFEELMNFPKIVDTSHKFVKEYEFLAELTADKTVTTSLTAQLKDLEEYVSCVKENYFTLQSLFSPTN